MKLKIKNYFMITNECYLKAIEILRKNLTPFGFMAGGKMYSDQVWARDTAIAGLGILQTKEKDLILGLKKSLENLKKSQTDLGMIPSFCSPRYIDYGKSGTIDSSLWYIILVEKYYQTTKDKKFLFEFWPSIKKTYTWLKYQDQNNFGLLDSQKGGEMFDAAIQRSGKVFYINLLWYQALKSIYNLSNEILLPMDIRIRMTNEYHLDSPVDEERPDYHPDSDENLFLNLENNPSLPDLKDISKTKKLINLLFWPEKNGIEKIYQLTKNSLNWDRSNAYFEHIDLKRDHYLMFVAFEDYEEHFDTLANILAILFDVVETDHCSVSTEKKQEKILNYIEKNKLAQPFPIKCLYPVAQSKDCKLWNRDVDKRRKKYWQCQPYHYWNAGIWPFIGGFYILALIKAGKKDQAEFYLEKLALLNKKNNWQFNEWFDGLKAKPSGQPFQTWSAGMYAGAYLELQN